MTGLALALLAVALGDLLLGIGGEALSADDARGRIGVATGTAALVALTGAGGVGMPAGSAVLLVLTAPLLVLGWTWARRWVASAGDPEAESGRARRVLAGGAALTVAGALTAPAVWRTPPDGWVVDYVALLPTSRSVPVLLLVAAVGLAQVATSNALVRLVLSASGTLREEAPEPVGAAAGSGRPNGWSWSCWCSPTRSPRPAWSPPPRGCCERTRWPGRPRSTWSSAR